MLSRAFLAPCQPSAAPRPPSGDGWVHEIKHDGFRLMACREAEHIRLLTRNGHDWADRYPAVVAAVRGLRARSCLVDGEIVVVRPDGLACFEMLRSRQHDAVALLYAFDLLDLDGEDLRREPFIVRKATLASLLAKAGTGLRLNEHIEGDGPTVFAHACKLGLEGIVSKRKTPLSVRPDPRLGEVQKPGQRGGAARGSRGLGPVTATDRSERSRLS